MKGISRDRSRLEALAEMQAEVNGGDDMISFLVSLSTAGNFSVVEIDVAGSRDRDVRGKCHR